MAVSFKHIFVQPLKKMQPLEALKDALLTNDEKIFALNTQQLDRGLDAKAVSLGKYKNFNYKKRYQPVDLLLTGDFRKKFTLEVRNTESRIFSQDWKDDILVSRYGKDIFGVPKVMYPNLGMILLDDFIKNVRKNFNG
jgi:hypothetical protein